MGDDRAISRSITSTAITPGRQDPAEGPAPSLPTILNLAEEQGQLGFWYHDLTTDSTTVSPGLARISGLPVAAKRTPDSMLRSVHPQDRPAPPQPGTWGRLRPEFRVVRPDGTIRWVSSRVDVVRGADGRVRRFIGTIVDITERRAAQQAVQSNCERHWALLRAVAPLTWVADVHGRVTDVEAWCRLTGMTPDRCQGDGWSDALHPDDRGQALAAYGRAIRREIAYAADYRLLTVDNGYRWFNARSIPIRDGTGRVSEWQGVLLPLDDEARGPNGEMDRAEPLTGPQIRGARGLLGWSLMTLAAASGISVSTIKRMEDPAGWRARVGKYQAIRRALEAGGVSFRVIDGVTWIGL